jgi:hypothetical protein
MVRDRPRAIRAREGYKLEGNMRFLGKWLIIAALATIGTLAYAAPAEAQATRTYVSGVGDDANPCSRTAPCKTFAGSISKTAPGGEINCLDPGGFGAVTITKSISIICDGTFGSILVSGTNGVVINGTGIVVNLSGLDFQGLGTSTNGIYVLNAAVVRIKNSTIAGFRNGYGVNFAPSTSASLYLQNVNITESGGSTTTTGGVTIAPAAGQIAQVSIRDSHITDNTNVGVRADTTGIAGSTIKLVVDNSEISGNTVGMLIKVPASTGTAQLMVTNSNISLNSGQGIIVNGGTAGMANAYVGNTTINGNATGVQAVNQARIYSYGDNHLDGNTADGAFSSTVAKH